MQGSLMVLLIINMIIVGVGAYKAPARLVGGLCGCCLCCLHLIWIIVTAVIRFSAKSELCALVTFPTNYTGVEERGGGWKEMTSNDDWTYEKDAALILALWILQLLCCCCCCCGAAVQPMSPPRK